jgi:polyisoprenyl-phosphate glycosyltransferase
MDFSVIVPVYNGEKTIGRLYNRINENLKFLGSFEVLFVYDRGFDNSWEILKELQKNDPLKIRIFKLKKNYGQHNAILFGIKEAIGDLIITLDEDLQHDPSLIIELTDKQKKGNYDVVYARFRKLKHPGLRISTSELLRGVLKRIIPGLFPGYSPFRLIKSETAKKISFLKNSYTFIDGYLGLVTENIGEIDAEHFRRADGVSSYSYFKLFKHAMMIAIAYSPLKKWILSSALFFNALSVLLFFIYDFMSDTSTFRVLGILTGIPGIILLLSGLTAEAIHFKGLKSNFMPTQTNAR